MSSAVGARVSPCSVGTVASEAASAPTEAKSRSVLRHCMILTLSKLWLSSACTNSRSERWLPERRHTSGLNGRPRAGGPEGAVAHRAAGAPGDLRQLGRIETAELVAVELAVGREGDVIDVEIEPHADRVGGDPITDAARLIERDLGVAGARRERAEHDGGAAALAPDQIGDGEHLLRPDQHDRGAWRLTTD